MSLYSIAGGTGFIGSNLKEAQAAHGSARAGDIPYSLADITKARELLGYEPVVGFEEGLRRTITWYEGGRAGS
jgi:nucleoside-diphosphate-sugar epimerase